LGGRAGLARQARALAVELAGQVLHAVVGERDGGGVEGVGFDQVGAGVEVGGVDRRDDVRPGQRQQVVVAALVVAGVGEALAAVVGLPEPVALDHGAHGAVEHQDAAGKRVLQRGDAPGMEPGEWIHFLRPISEMTSKWGGRRSRVTVPADNISSPAFSTKRRSSLAVKPRLAWPKASTTLRWSWRARLDSTSWPPGRSTRAASATACAGLPA